MEDKSFLSQVKGFTPVIDVLAQELDTMTALVYGIVWRYCQMEDKVCRASKETIGNHANISPKTVQRHLQALVKAGYLEDTTPDWKHKPHVYKDAGKVQINGLVEAKLAGRSESPTSQVGGSESPTRRDRESQLGRSESPVKRVLDDTLEDRKEGETPAPDYLDHVLEHSQKPDRAGVADPSQDLAAFMEYASEFLKAYHDITSLHAARSQKHKIEQLAEKGSGLEFWRDVVDAWVGAGWNPKNIDGMIDCYLRGEIPSTGKKKGQSKQKQEQERRDPAGQYSSGTFVKQGMARITAAMEGER